MERAENTKKRKKNINKESKPDYFPITHLNYNTIFPLLLSTLYKNKFSSSPNSKSFIKKCLNKLLPIHNPLPNYILSLLPILLTSKYSDIVVLSLEIVGLASILSMEMNEKIAMDSDIVKSLIMCLGSSYKRVSIAACNAVLDFSTTSIGRHRLLEFYGLDKLIIFLLQGSESAVISLCSDDRGNVANSKIAFEEDGRVASLLNAAIYLTNTCNMEQLEKVSRSLCASFLEFLKKLWKKVHSQMLHGNCLISVSETSLHTSNVTVNGLAESIFRFSMSTDQVNRSPSDSVMSRVFGLSDFQTFLLCSWEASPFFVTRSAISSMEMVEIFSPFTKCLVLTEPTCGFLSPMLQSFISCPPIASDELDMLKFLEEVRNELGCPIVYKQDIRVVRTEKQSKREMHLFPEIFDPCHIRTPHVLSLADIMKCEEAFKQGYTIALRGMEFRFGSIAAITDSLACLFGQPSVGANLYLTPPNSQGLACHYDDHCVFVCQLFGTKQWTIFSEPNFQLPRLYDPITSQSNFHDENSSVDHRKFFLREGDVLYVPRGFAHEACTDDTTPGELTGFSLHITFGIEVEPPFEWTGFAHVAFHHWTQTQKQYNNASAESLSESLNSIIVYMLHSTIELIGSSDPTFRKACLVAALSPAFCRNDWLYSNQKTTFLYVINRISTDSRLMEVIRILETAIENKDLRWMSWIHLCDKENEATREDSSDATRIEVEKLLPVYSQQQDHVKTAFMQLKAKFCSEVSFDDVMHSYITLFEKYRTARKQYMNGMLSLHSNYNV